MTPLRAILVDDERLARKRLATLLAAHPEITVVGEAADIVAARALVDSAQPDVVFLDIQMPPENGFDLVPHLSARVCIVFVTAHDAFALRAFEVNALDYLLKPVHPDRLAETLSRLRRHGRTQSGETSAPPTKPAPRLNSGEPILLRDARQWRVLDPNSIEAIEAEGSYSRVWTGEKTSIFILRALGQWEQILPKGAFHRISRSLLINMEKVRRLDVRNRDEADLFLTGSEQPLRLGRIASIRLRQLLRTRKNSAAR
jgi:two-component system LytT family response regulator